ncbi:hypothetical protein NCAS_0G01870 [Naumovozyma castellii]|uniref:Uncharacterized protein n=1 Tax=Naumovozyma castellii TaxID=27288 RepID=G0VI40_NAUCA|nr:hypothetical protein NCAS_0G01870 [Naumovozyma castellii CBS 4309]CCC71074.1 hypothetical protein NCAS_0G01870 [Naumovozyma castellii CBS 4309]
MNNEIYETPNQSGESTTTTTSTGVAVVTKQGVTREEREFVKTSFLSNFYQGIRIILISTENLVTSLEERIRFTQYQPWLSFDSPKPEIYPCTIDQHKDILFLTVPLASIVDNLSEYCANECFKPENKKKNFLKTVITKVHQFRHTVITNEISREFGSRAFTPEDIETSDDLANIREKINRAKNTVGCLIFKKNANKKILKRINGPLFFWKRISCIGGKERQALRYLEQYEVNTYKRLYCCAMKLRLVCCLRWISKILCLVPFALGILLLSNLSLGPFGWNPLTILSMGVPLIGPILERQFFSELDPLIVSSYMKTFRLKPWNEDEEPKSNYKVIDALKNYIRSFRKKNKMQPNQITRADTSFHIE